MVSTKSKLIMALAVLALAVSAFAIAVPADVDAADLTVTGEQKVNPETGDNYLFLYFDQKLTGVVTVSIPEIELNEQVNVNAQDDKKKIVLDLGTTVLDEGTYTVILSGPIEFTGTITIGDVPAPVITEITVDASAAKLNYTVGDELDATGVIVKAVYDDASEVIVTEGVTYNPTTLATEGTQTITVSYQGFTATYEVTVAPETPVTPTKTLESITISGEKTEFAFGEAFSADDLVVTAVYSDETTAVVTDFVIDNSAYNAGIAGTYTITVTYTEENVTATKSYDVTVAPETPVVPTKTLESITISGEKTEFAYGEQFSAADLKVTATYNDETTADVSDSAVVDDSAYKADVAGTYTITVSYTEGDAVATTSYEVTVAAAPAPTPGEPVDPEDMKDLTVGGIAVQTDKPTVYDVNQRVNVVSDWTLTENAIVYIYGQLVVPAGITVTVEAGAQLILSNPSDKMNVAEIEGTLVIEEEEEKIAAGSVSVLEGTVSVSGALEVSGNMLVQGGELVIEKDSKAIVEEAGILVAESDITVKEGAVLNIDGEAEFLFLMVYGTVVFDSEVDSEGGFIFLMADGATVDIQMFTSSYGGLVISDSQLVLYSYKDKETKETVDITVSNHGKDPAVSTSNTIVLFVQSTGDDVVGHLTGITIVEKVTSKSGKVSDLGYVEKSKKTYTNTIDISGKVFADAEYTGTAADAPENMAVEADIAVLGIMGITVDNGLVLNDDVAFHNLGVLKVSTLIDASAEKASFRNYNMTDGDVTIAGKITLSDAGEIVVYKNVISDKAGINAAYYKETVEVDKKKEYYYHYITIDAALTLVNAEGNVIDKIDVIGSNTLNASNGVPKDVTLNLNEGSKVTVGAKAGADVTLTVVKGADLKGTGTVDVKGTLLVEDKRDRVSTVTVLSDVYSEQIDADGKAVKDGWAKWTNLTTALDSAVAGDVIEIYRTTGNVEIASNTTIKAGVSVIVKDGKAAILIKDGVTLTIDGALYSEEEVYAETLFQTTAMNVDESEVMDAKKSSTIIVNGYLITSQKAVYADSTGTALSAGAPIAGVYYEIEDYGFVISTLENAIAVMDIVLSDLTVYGPVTAGDVTYTATDYSENIIVSSVVVKDIDGKDIKPSLKIGTLTLVGSELQAYAAVTGTVKVADAAVVFDKVVGAVVTDDEKLLLTGNVVKGDISVAAGKVTVTEKLLTVGDVIVTVDAGAELIAEGATIVQLDINGTVSVASAKMLRAGTVTVLENGVLSVAPLTSTTSPGVANIAALQVGIDYLEFSKDTTAAAAATVNGPVKVSYWAIVLNGAVLDDAAKASLADFKNTEYYVEDALWITVYDVDADLSVDDIFKIPVENAFFTGDWTDADGKDICDAAVGSKGAEKAYADIEYDVYNIIVLANEGIDDVFIDGILMAHGTSNSHFAVVKAGNHEITYKLANGYTGTAKLYVDGKAQSGMTFTTSGTPETSEGIDYTLQISGIEKSGYVDPTPAPAPAEEKDEGLALTDILLIVLVILAAILVIVVAIRMMRS